MRRYNEKEIMAMNKGQRDRIINDMKKAIYCAIDFGDFAKAKECIDQLEILSNQLNQSGDTAYPWKYCNVTGRYSLLK